MTQTNAIECNDELTLDDLQAVSGGFYIPNRGVYFLNPQPLPPSPPPPVDH
jgi:hypothetical protein